jgi:hypothetical protein
MNTLKLNKARDRISDQGCDNTMKQLRLRVGDTARTQVDKYVWNQIMFQLWQQVWSQICIQIRLQSMVKIISST